MFHNFMRIILIEENFEFYDEGDLEKKKKGKTYI